MGDAQAAARSVGESQHLFAMVDHENEPEWARFIDGAYLNGEYAHVFRDLHQPDRATEYANASANIAHQQRRARRGSLAQAALARAALDSHDLEAAAIAGVEAVTLAASVKSSRSVGAVSDLRERLAPHQGSPAIRDFFETAQLLMPVNA